MMKNNFEIIDILKTETKMVIPEIRLLSEMKDVIYDREWLSNADNIGIYYMYRHIHITKQDTATMKKHGLRYDITIIPPLMLGCEFVKTMGHYHQIIPGENITFPEIYEVLDGEAYYLIQNFDTLRDIALIKAKQGDKVIIPPGYGHITINISNKILEMANWVAADLRSYYWPIKEKKGGAYFFTQNGIIKNSNYKNVPEIRILKPIDDKEIGLQKGDSMYNFVKDMDKLEFLTKPQKYGQLFGNYLY